MLSAVLILPIAQVQTGNAVSEAMGWGAPSYTVPLSPTGNAPATHMGLHAWVTEEFGLMLGSGEMPQSVIDAGITAAAYTAMLSALIVSIVPDYDGHFAGVAADNGLAVLSDD